MKLVMNELRQDAYKFLRIEHEPGEVVFLRKFVPHYIIEHFPEVISVTESEGFIEVYFPFMGAAQFKVGDGWKEFFVVHRLYGTGIRDCVRLGVDAWAYVKRTPEHAFVSRLPVGVESGLEVNGIHLFQAEWMMRDAVAVG